MRPRLSRTQPTARSNRGTASPALPEAPHFRLILRDPLGDLLPGELAWRRRLHARTAQTRSEEQDKFLLLLWGERVGGGFDFSKRAHPGMVA
jgi:hypothetical protein